MREFIISSEQLERLIKGIEHDTGREITEVVCDGTELEELVRCADCMYFKPGEEEPPIDWCDWFDGDVTPDGFCPWGVATCINESEDGFLCSACSFGDFSSFKFEPRYCPNCGRKVMA